MAALRAAGGVRHCQGCEGTLAAGLGAEQSLAGMVTRITRTDYPLQIIVRDLASGAILANSFLGPTVSPGQQFHRANSFSGLRMGANYAWPRGTRWLVNNTILKRQLA